MPQALSGRRNRALSAVAALAITAAGALPAVASATTVTLSADKTKVSSGKTVDFTVVITKTPTATHGEVNYLSDSLAGRVDKNGQCPLTPGAMLLTMTTPTYRCTYSLVIDGDGGTTQTHTLFAGGVEATCTPTQPAPAATCPGVGTSYSAVLSVLTSNPVTITIKCKKGEKLKKGKCVKKGKK